MKITAIKQQAKRSDRYNIYVDGKFSLALSGDELLRLGLRNGQEITQAELVSLKADGVRDKARYQSLNLLARRPRSEWELQDYLKKKNYDPGVIEQVLQWLKEYTYVDDRKFAEAWVTNRRLLKATSKQRLR